MILFVAV